jgi:hypothetical protein
VGAAPNAGGCLTSFDIKYTVKEEWITPKQSILVRGPEKKVYLLFH